MHKQLVQANVNIGDKQYVKVECTVNEMDSGDVITLTPVQAYRYNVGLTLEAQRKLRDSYLESKGLKVSMAKGKTITKGESLSIDID